MDQKQEVTVSSQPSSIAPPSLTRWERTQKEIKDLGTQERWIGGYDFGLLCLPRLNPWKRIDLNEEQKELPFFGLEDRLPLLVAIVAGLQHCLAMLAGLITPPIILSSSLNLPPEMQSYLVSASLISAGILSAIQMSRIPLPFGYQLGTGLLSVVGTSFATLSTATAIFQNLYSDGTCPMNADGTRGACPEAYGYLLGTSAVCALAEMALSFLPVRILKRVFPPIITGPVVFLIGSSLIGDSGFANWGGGSGSCLESSTVLCQVGSHEALWGSAEFLGLGFLSFSELLKNRMSGMLEDKTNQVERVTIVIVEIFGSPSMRNGSIIIGLLFPLVVAGPLNYISSVNIDSAPVGTFLWVHTFPLKVYGPAVLPLLAVYLSLAAEAVGDITASAEASRLPVDGASFDKRIQGGLLSDGLAGTLSALFTVTPMSLFAQNNGVIVLTRCGNRGAGYCCCAFLILFGVLGKISGAVLSIPSPILGGVTTFLFASVATSGLKILSLVKYTRRNRFILATSLSLGMGNLLLPDWSSNLFTYSGDNKALQGFLSSIIIVISTPFLISAISGQIANFVLPKEAEDLIADEERMLMAERSDREERMREEHSHSHRHHAEETGSSSTRDHVQVLENRGAEMTRQEGDEKV